ERSLASAANSNSCDDSASPATRLFMLIAVRDLPPLAIPMDWSRDGKIDLCARQHHQVDAAVEGSSFRGCVAGHGMEFGITGGGEPVGRKGAKFEKEPCDARRARRRKLPVGIEVVRMDWHVIRVALDAQVVRCARQGSG